MKRLHADFLGLNIDMAVGLAPGVSIGLSRIKLCHWIKESFLFVLTLGSMSLVTVTLLVLVATTLARAYLLGIRMGY